MLITEVMNQREVSFCHLLQDLFIFGICPCFQETRIALS